MRRILTYKKYYGYLKSTGAIDKITPRNRKSCASDLDTLKIMKELCDGGF